MSTNLKRKPARCLTPKCKNTVRGRGLCPNCYAAAYRLVAKGKVSWTQLEQKGLCKPAHTVPLSDFAVAVQGRQLSHA